VKLLLDECVDRRFAHDLAGHEVTTVPRRGWAGIKNGDFLALAEKEFDAFVTVDRTRKRARSDEISNSSAASFQVEILVASKCVPLEFAALSKAEKLAAKILSGKSDKNFAFNDLCLASSGALEKEVIGFTTKKE
jgi:Domain of unknown function (DUF5615)